MEERNDKEKVREWNWTNAILPMRIALFVTLLLLGVGVTIFFGFYDYEEYWQEGSKNKEEFYASEACEGVLNSWSAHLCAFMEETKDVWEEQTATSDDKMLYSLTEYSELTDKNLFHKSMVTQDTLPKETITFSGLQEKDDYVADSIRSGVDRGEECAFFYNNLKSNLQALTGSKDIKGFIHLNGREFYALLDKYCTAENLEQEHIKMQFPGELERFSDSYPEDDEEPTETIEEPSKEASDYTPRGFYNDYNGNLIIYSYYGGEDGNGHFLMMAKDTLYDYAMKDVSISKDFYIPTALLDYSSRENFEKSLITTPFSTVEAVMAYLSMQTNLKETGDEVQWSHYYDFRTMNEFEYAITYLDGNHKEQVLTNCHKSRLESGTTLVYDKNKGTVTTNIKGADYTKDKDFFEDFKELKGITKVELRLDSGFGFNSIGVVYLLSLAAAHKSAIIMAGVLLTILAFVLIIGMVCLLPKQVYPRDCHSLLTKTLVYGGIAGIFCTAAIALLYYVCHIGMYFNPVIRLVAVGIAFVFLLGVAYAAISEYFFSIIRLVKAKQFKKHLFLYRMYRKLTGKVKQLFHGIKQYFVEIWSTTGYVKKTIIKKTVFLLGIAGSVFMMVLSAYADVGIFVLFFFLVLCAILVLKAYDDYQFVLDQKMLDKIMDGIMQLTDGDLSYKINTDLMKGDKKKLAEMINHISDGLEKAIAQSIKDERLKAELITNVSHDIKTPLTSIINYVDLIKREHISEEPLKGYIEVLDQKSQRLKQLTEDLVEASKASTGNIELEPVNLNMTELLSQTIGEFEDKFSEKNLTLVPTITEEDVVIFADGRRCYRIFENLFQNIYKYAMPNTRVYLSLEPKDSQVVLCLKNISESPLTVDVSELTGRFVRGDASRTTEGSGLGLSIAQSLTTLQNGSFHVELDGDLFKVTIIFEQQRK